ncbi:MAG: hypothetical protein QOG16_541, partial [Actinomycetota bacterium]|nr:hypothetical protein [Actinomycetota bacterium]
MRRGFFASIALTLLFASACSDDPTVTATSELLVAIDAPSTGAPYVGETIEQGVRLAVDQINERGGIATNHGTYTLRVETYDNA